MSCRELERLFLSGVSQGEAPAAAHRASCPTCEALGKEMDSLTSFSEALARPQARPALREALLAIPRETVSCEGADRLIALSVEEEMPAGDRIRLENHFTRCPACAAAADALSGLRQLALPQPPPFFAARIAASRPRRRRRIWQGLWSPKAAIALAYGAAVIVMLAGFNPADLARKAGVARIEENTKAAVGVAKSSLADKLGAWEEDALRKFAVWRGRASGYGRAVLSNAIQLVMKTEPPRPPSRSRSGEGKGVPKNETMIAGWRA